MCLSADEINPLCDECFARLKEYKGEDEFTPCKHCQAFLEGLCMCCYTRYDPPADGDIRDGVCKHCKGD